MLLNILMSALFLWHLGKEESSIKINSKLNSSKGKVCSVKNKKLKYISLIIFSLKV